MTEINTNEIRASLQGDDHPSTEAEIRALCDALDEARRDTRDMDEYDARWFALHDELDAARAERERTVGEYIIAIDAAWTRAEAAERRAEAAEAQLATERKANSIAEGQWAERCYDAEARIAAALAIHKRVELGDYLDGSPMPDVCLACQENNVAGKKLWPCPTVRALTEGTGQ